MVRLDRSVRLLLLLSLAGGISMACSASGSSDKAMALPGEYDPGADAGQDGAGTCLSSMNCPAGYTCEQGSCRPPEVEQHPAAERAPAASPHYVFALNPAANAVARVDPATLAIEAVIVGANPTELAVLPGEDVAVVLSEGDASLSIVDASTSPTRVWRLALERPYSRLALSADGAFAVAYSDPTVAPANGAEGIVALIDLKQARAGAPRGGWLLERAVGFRVTDVVFRLVDGKAVEALVVAKDTLARIDLIEPAAQPLPLRLALPASMSASMDSREVVATPDGATVLIRSTSAAELAWFDGAALRTVTLPEVATDLDLLPDGTGAAAALRASGKLAFLEIPGDLLDPSGIAVFDLSPAEVGQVVLPPAGTNHFALVFSTAGAAESFARVDLPAGTVSVFGLQKRVAAISFSPDGRSALVVHRSDPSSTAADAYERAVDADEGYSVFDVRSGYLQLKRTGSAAPGPWAFSPSGGWAAVSLQDAANKRFRLDLVDLGSLVTSTLGLASSPLFMGPVPVAQGLSPHRVFVSQSHPAGRLSVVALDEAQVRTVTGFTLNAEIQ